MLCDRLGPETPLLLLAEEGLAAGGDVLAGWIEAQPEWSDLPVIVLSAGGAQRGSAARWRLFERLGNVTILDRPLHARALQSAVRSALRARERQYQTRSHLEELQTARDGLEKKVAERTFQLQAEIIERRQVEAALLRAQRLEAVAQLTGGVAHDFNNLLQVVTGGISLLERHIDNPQRRGTIIESMRQASDRGAKLTQQLLAFARRQPLAAEPIDPGAHIALMRELLQGSLRADIALNLCWLPDLWPVEADSTQLEVAIVNLVVNARDAMSASGTVTILAENVVLAPSLNIEGLTGDFVRMAVSDTGAGMDEATLSRAFDPFFTTKPSGRGTGLGLSQVYGFARQSGGSVHIESTPGWGTTVSLYLPRSSRPLSSKPSQEPPSAKHGSGLLLVVEDEAELADIVCAMLQDLGYRYEHVTSADAALELDISHFDGVFSDVIMPGKIDGIALAKHLREQWPNLPILLTTGFAGAPERITAAGFPVLRKPYTLAQLSMALGLLFKKRQ